MDLEEILLDAEERMEKAVEFFGRELDTVRTGRANTALVEGLKVDYYGTKTSIRELCALSVPEPRLIVIRPFDPGSLQEVEKAVLKSDLGIAPMNDGKLLRLVIPPLTEETRKQLATRLKEMSEEAKTAVRNVRRDANKGIDAAQKDGGAPEDDAYKAKDDVQDLVKGYEGKIDELLGKKTEEVMEV
ncbi:ribosome recycling factor [Planctomycetota bacterium]